MARATLRSFHRDRLRPAHGLDSRRQHPSCRIRFVDFAFNATSARSGLTKPIETTVWTWLVLTFRRMQLPLADCTSLPKCSFN